jgi:hypothetical protein
MQATCTGWSGETEGTGPHASQPTLGVLGVEECQGDSVVHLELPGSRSCTGRGQSG